MKCMFCLKENEKLIEIKQNNFYLYNDDRLVCNECDNWIFSSKNTSSSFQAEKLSAISFNLPYHTGSYNDIYVVFNYALNKTFIGKRGLIDKTTGEYIPNMYGPIIDFGKMLPLTKKFLEDVPKNIKLWQTFS